MWKPWNKHPSFNTEKRSKKNDERSMLIASGLLGEPKMDRVDGENVVIGDLEIGHSSMQGYRPSMEGSHNSFQISSTCNPLTFSN